MHAYDLTSRQRDMVKQLATDLFNKRIDDALTRSQYLMFAAMIDVGLSPRTVNRVAGMLSECAKKYADYRTDELADYIFFTRLQKAGVDVKPTTEEIKWRK